MTEAHPGARARVMTRESPGARGIAPAVDGNRPTNPDATKRADLRRSTDIPVVR